MPSVTVLADAPQLAVPVASGCVGHASPRGLPWT